MGIRSFSRCQRQRKTPLSLQNLAGTRAESSCGTTRLGADCALSCVPTHAGPMITDRRLRRPYWGFRPFCLPSRVHSSACLLPPRTARRLSERKPAAEYSSRSSVYGRHRNAKEIKCQPVFCISPSRLLRRRRRCATLGGKGRRFYVRKNHLSGRGLLLGHPEVF